jgi:acyl-coenzyme A thioesterase PaaI-like protein
MQFTAPAALVKLGINLWPPFVGAGISVRHIAPDFREVYVEMELGLRNRGYFGTHFGGSLYAMTDPFFALMLLRNLGTGYRVWDQAASIEFVAPGRGTVHARFALTERDLAQIRRATEDGEKHLHLFKVEVRDEHKLVVARVEKVVYVRRKRSKPA